MVQRITYRRRKSFNTRSNKIRKVKTPGGKLAVQYLQKKPRGVMCGDCKTRLQGVRRRAMPGACRRAPLFANRRSLPSAMMMPSLRARRGAYPRRTCRSFLPHASCPFKRADPDAPPEGVCSPRPPREDGHARLRWLALRQVRPSAVSRQRRLAQSAACVCVRACVRHAQTVCFRAPLVSES
jgi:ribosomal protein L34E